MNTAFSSKATSLQLAWDSTSLGQFKECPRKYYMNIVCGHVPRSTSVHLLFGQYFHAGLEKYDHARAAGAEHRDAQLEAVRHTMDISWDREKNRPWYSDDTNKNRFTLVRSVSWYLDQFADDPIQTIILANGKPAVELSFRMNTDYVSRLTGEPFLLCGHLDRLGKFNDEIYVIDRKTSKSTINAEFFEKFSPDNQFTLYVLAARNSFALPVRGLICDAAQVAVTFTRFRRGFITRTDAQLDEWYEELGWWLGLVEHCVEHNIWPQNDKSCGSYGGCPYRSICAKSPSVRDQWLKAEFHQRTWDPLQVRGDI